MKRKFTNSVDTLGHFPMVNRKVNIPTINISLLVEAALSFILIYPHLQEGLEEEGFIWTLLINMHPP